MDYMTAKAYYTTTITADKRYTNVISNGDLAPGYSTSQGIPVGHPPPLLAPSDVAPLHIERQTLRYHNHLTNMAPYLVCHIVHPLCPSCPSSASAIRLSHVSLTRLPLTCRR